MISAGLLLLPLLAALLITLLRGRGARTILRIAGAANLGLIAAAFRTRVETLDLGRGIALGYDVADPGFVVLAVSGILYSLAVLYLPGWLDADRRAAEARGGEHDMREWVFAALLPVFLSSMTLTALARDFGMLWIAVEATTLASAPLIHFHRSPGSLEAMWKYLLLCSLGIGLALFGTMLLSASLAEGATLEFNGMRVLYPQWYKAAFVICFAGYGLKAGLAPFHSWLPDAHSEAPAPVSGLLSGSLLNCAMLGLWRIRAAAPAGLTEFTDGVFIFFGFLSLAIAALFIIRQKDFKRMLAYSSVEHLGLIALMTGFAVEGAAMTHMFAHSLTKMMLFLTAGDLLLAFGSRRIGAVSGAFVRTPRNGRLWMIGLLMICGMPPSPLFFTELALVVAAGPLFGGLTLFLLFILFCAMTGIAFRMCMGEPPASDAPELDDRAEKLAWVPGFILGTVLLAGCGIAVLMIVK